MILRPPSRGGLLPRLGALLLLVSALSPTALLGQSDTVLSIGTLRNGVVVPTRVQPGEVATVGIHYQDPSSNIQGFTLTLCYDPILNGVPNSFAVSPLLSGIGAEFVSAQVDDLETDGDGKEVIIGILLDAAPPFGAQTAPPTDLPLEIGTVQFQVPSDLDCFTCLDIVFCDGINGNGNVSLSNRVVIEAESIQPVALVAGQICVPRHALFIRGDANNDTWIDIGDTIYILSYLFLLGEEPKCLDAADADGDDYLTITDAVYLNLYIFQGGISPPTPFPDCGIESNPDEDGLDCFEPTELCPVCP
ncbi:MAG: hypothetical protein ACO4BJ_02460 [Planctomycetota bacterium]|jgi:hypothetical protein